MIGPLINIPALSKPNMIQRPRVFHGSRVRIFSQMKSPIRKMTRASDISDRTSVANRGLSRLKPNAANAMIPAAFPYARDALCNNTNAISAAQTNDGNRHAISHERVIAKIAADIQPVSGGLVASP